jgi:hypothetical protein
LAAFLAGLAVFFGMDYLLRFLATRLA